MITRTARILFLAMLIAILSQPAFAYRFWEPEDGVPIRQNDGMEVTYYSNYPYATNGDVVLIAWYDARTGDNDIYAQLFNADGEPQWDEDGQLIARVADSRQEDPHVLAASDGTWIITWMDYRNDSDIYELSDIFMQKVNNEGEIQWPVNAPDYGGVPVSIVQDKRLEYPVAFDDGAGGAIAIWGTTQHSVEGLCAMHILSDGTPDARWNLNGNVFAEDGNIDVSYGQYVAMPDDNHGIIAAWREGRNPTSTERVFMNRMNAEGELIWGPATGIELDTVDVSTLNLCAAPDGEGGAFVGRRTFDEETEQDFLVVQHVTCQGELDWDDGGVFFSLDTDYINLYASYRHPVLVPVTDREVVLACEIFYYIGNEFANDIFIQKISLDEDNQPVLEWGEDGEEQYGIVLCDEAGRQSEVKGCPDGEGGVVFSWQDKRDGSYYGRRVYSQHVNSDGSFSWDDGGVVAGTTGSYSCVAHGSCLVGDDVMVFWLDGNRGHSSTNMQIHDFETGAIQLDEEGVPVSTGIDDNAKFPVVSFDPHYPDHVWFAWEDCRFGSYGSAPFFQKVDLSTGQVAFDLNGQNVIPHYPFFEGQAVERVSVDSVRMITDGNGGIYLSWVDSRPLYSMTAGFQHVLEDGTRDWGDQGNMLPLEMYYSIYDSRLLPVPDEGVFVAMTGECEGFVQQVLFQKINNDGTFVFEGNNGRGITLSEDTQHNQNVKGLTFFDNAVQTPPVDATICVIYEKDYGDRNLDVFACGVTQDGEILWTTPICVFEERQRNTQFVNINEGILIVWQDERGGSPNKDIYGQILLPDGSVAWDENGILLADAYGVHVDFSIASNDGSSFWLAWTDLDDANENLYSQKFDLEGNALLQPNTGVQIADNEAKDQKPNIVADTEGGVILTWQVEQSSYQVDLFCTQLDAEGSPVEGMPEMNGVPLSTAYHIQKNVDMVPDGTNGAFVIWEDYRSTDIEFRINTYAQHINLLGTGVDSREKLVPSEWSLSPAYPNPFNPSTQIGFSLDQRMPVTLTVYDVLGRQVVKLVDGVKDAGRHVVTWNGMDTHGRAVASGTYFYKLEGDGKQLVQKMVLVK